MSRYVWNNLVAESKRIFRDDKTSTFGPAQQDKYLTRLRATTTNEAGEHWLACGSSVVQQQTVRDFAASRAKALKDRKNKVHPAKRAGLPRFKKRGKARATLNYTKRGFSLKVDKSTGKLRLHLAGGIIANVVWSQELPSAPTSVRVYQDSLGHWYATFRVLRDHPHAPALEDAVAVGVDWGVKEIATTACVNLVDGTLDESTRFDLVHAEHGRAAAEGLAATQRQMARRKRHKSKPPTSGYTRAAKKAAKLHKRVARKRKDDARKWAKGLVTASEFIAVEDFKPKFLAKTTMARKSQDAAISATKAELVWQAVKHGRTCILVDPKNTTQDCGACGAKAKQRMELKDRVFECWKCGTARARDKNSAIVMVARAGFVPRSR